MKTRKERTVISKVQVDIPVARGAKSDQERSTLLHCWGVGSVCVWVC